MEPSSPAPPDKRAVTIARLLSTRRWIQLEALLVSEPRLTLPIDDPSLLHAVTAESIVHFAACFNAPPRIISLLAQLYPHSLTSSDATGRYPIHIAARWGATPDIIAYLIRSNPSAAGVPDSTGKTPMHYVGEFYLASFDNEFFGRDESMLGVVRLLKDAAPRSVNLEDDDGMNALEYALLSGAHLAVVRTMQHACRDDWRERSKSNDNCVLDGAYGGNEDTVHKPQHMGRRRHQDLVKDIETMSSKLRRVYISGSVESRVVNGIARIHAQRTRAKANTQIARMA